MTHKHFVERIVDWYELRTEQKQCHPLTCTLLAEEMEEFALAVKDVDRLDALADIIFVAVGAMWKIGLSKNQIVTAMHIVCDANDTKAKDKFSAIDKYSSKGKGPNFVAPEPQLEALLDERRN